MSNDVTVIAAIPHDLSRMPDVGKPMPEVTPRHTRMRCSVCRHYCWIGPNQFDRWRGTAWPVWCYACLYDAIEAGNPVGGLFNA